MERTANSQQFTTTVFTKHAQISIVMQIQMQLDYMTIEKVNHEVCKAIRAADKDFFKEGAALTHSFPCPHRPVNFR